MPEIKMIISEMKRIIDEAGIDYTQVEADNPAKRLMARRAEADAMIEKGDLEGLRALMIDAMQGKPMWVHDVRRAETIEKLAHMFYNFIMGAMGLSRRRASGAGPGIPESREVSEDVEVILNGQKYLLQKGDKIGIVTEAAVPMSVDDAYMAIDRFVQSFGHAYRLLVEKLDTMGWLGQPKPDFFHGPVDEAEYPPIVKMSEDLMEKLDEVDTMAKQLRKVVRDMP